MSTLKKLAGQTPQDVLPPHLPDPTGAHAPVGSAFIATDYFAWLDAHQVPFRASITTLIDRFGLTPNDWRPASDDLVLPNNTPLFVDAHCGPATTIGSGAIRDLPPRQLTSYIRKHDNTYANVALAEAALTEVFGPPTSRGRTNAIELRWSDPVNPECHIRVLGFPRSDPWNQSPNTRHARVPGSATEAQIILSTDFCPALSMNDVASLSDLSPVLSPSAIADMMPPSLGYAGFGFSRPALPDFSLQPGFWRNGRGTTFVMVERTGRFVMFKQEDVVEILLDEVKPAKGGGSTGISIEITKYGLERSLTLTSDRYGSPAIAPLARRVAGLLDRPLRKHESYDC